MKRAPILAAGLALALAACSAESTAEEEPEAAAPEVSAPAEEEAPEQAEEPESTPEPEPEPEPTAESAYADRGKTDRGDIIKEVGDLAGLTSATGNTSLVDFVLTAVRLDPECNSGFAEAPANGHYLALDFEVTTYPELAQEDFPEFWLSEHDMVVFNADGSRLNDPVGNAFSCLSSAEMLPNPMGAAENATGSIVLDVRDTTGTIALRPSGSPTGWSWDY